MTDFDIVVQRLPSGYWHVRGRGPCNWAQPAVWPCSFEHLEQTAHPEASVNFLASAAATAATAATDAAERLKIVGIELKRLADQEP